MKGLICFAVQTFITFQIHRNEYTQLQCVNIIIGRDDDVWLALKPKLFFVAFVALNRPSTKTKLYNEIHLKYEIVKQFGSPSEEKV